MARKSTAVPAPARETEIILAEQHALQQTSPTVEDLMARAIDRGDTATMQMLMQMRREMKAEAAEEAFSAAMTQAQSEMGRIAANAKNPNTKSRYATYDALDRVLRPLYTKHGFALNFNSDENCPPQYVHVFCDVSHSGGCSRRYWCPLIPADGKGPKGGDVMSLTHAAASGISYSMRYLLKMIFNVAIGEDDDDGNGGAGAFVEMTEGQLADLSAKIEETGANRVKFLEFMQVESLEEISASRYDFAIRTLVEIEQKRKSK